MNNKGFTLIEVIGVVVVLGILISIATVSVVAIMNRQSAKINEENLKNVKDAALIYAVDKNITKTTTITVDTLKQENIFEDNDDNRCSGNIVISKAELEGFEVDVSGVTCKKP